MSDKFKLAADLTPGNRIVIPVVDRIGALEAWHVVGDDLTHSLNGGQVTTETGFREETGEVRGVHNMGFFNLVTVLGDDSGFVTHYTVRRDTPVRLA